MTPDLIKLALDIAHETAESDLECFCKWDTAGGNGQRDRWYLLDTADPNGEAPMVERAALFLDLAGRLERRADNPRIVRIKAGERAHG